MTPKRSPLEAELLRIAEIQGSSDFHKALQIAGNILLKIEGTPAQRAAIIRILKQVSAKRTRQSIKNLANNLLDVNMLFPEQERLLSMEPFTDREATIRSWDESFDRNVPLEYRDLPHNFT